MLESIKLVLYQPLSTTELIIFGSIVGLLSGSFSSVLCYRLPIMLGWSDRKLSDRPFNLFLPLSTCPHCQHRIPFWLNVPVLSYLLLLGKCHFCRHPIGVHYLLIEICLALVCSSIFALSGHLAQGFALSLFALLSLNIAIIDWRYLCIPDSLNYALLWSGLIYQLWQGNAELAIISAVVGYCSLYGINLLFKWIRRKQGIGHGDFKLFAALGVWLGWFNLPSILLYASLLGVTFALVQYLVYRFKRIDANLTQPIAFAPWLVIASMLTWLQQQPAIISLIN